MAQACQNDSETSRTSKCSNWQSISHNEPTSLPHPGLSLKLLFRWGSKRFFRWLLEPEGKQSRWGMMRNFGTSILETPKKMFKVIVTFWVSSVSSSNEYIWCLLMRLMLFWSLKPCCACASRSSAVSPKGNPSMGGSKHGSWKGNRKWNMSL